MNEDRFFPEIPGMTEDEVLNIVQRVIDKTAPKYTFFGYEVDDIKQESYFICREGLQNYDPEQGELENFLSVHLPFRLLNFMRKMSMLKDSNEQKQKIYKPAQLEEGFNRDDDADFDLGAIDTEDMIKIIDRELPVGMRRDWLKMMSEATVPKPRREEITNYVREILESYGYETF